ECAIGLRSRLRPEFEPSMPAPAPALDHKSAIAGLSPQERERLLAKSDRAGAGQLAAHLGAMALMVPGMALDTALGWVCTFVYGVLLVFLFTAQHECVHFTAFATRRANQWVANAVGALLFNPAHWFRYFHLAHHRYTQDPERDPELASAKPDTAWRYLWHVLGWRVLASGVATVLRNARSGERADWLPANQRDTVTRESRVLLLCYAAAFGVASVTSFNGLLTFWLVPLLLGQPILRLYLLAEHGRCPFVANMFENTRTTFTNALVRRLAWNMPYHAEHHAFPSVPFHRLPVWHRHVRDQLKCTSCGYTQFHRAYVEDFR
ncbi:MAG: fatty acid desaturase, partial [Pseudomonadota bacterium]